MARSLRLLILLVSLPLAAEELARDRADIRVKKVTDSIYVAYRPEPLRPYVEGNVTIIINERDVVLVDAGGSPSTARKVIAHIRRLTPNPVRFIVVTHIHRDHRFGLQEYLAAYPALEVIGHPLQREIIDRPASAAFVTNTIERLQKGREETEREIDRLRREAAPGHEKVIAHLRRYLDHDLAPMLDEYRTIRNLGPTATVDHELVLHRGRRTIEILHLGRGDTDHELIVHLPLERVVAAGDLVVHPFPYGFSDHPAEWVATLQKLAELEIEHLIPGHGEVQRGETYLGSIIALVASVQTQVAAAAGLDLESTRRRVDLTSFERELAGDDPVRRYYFHQYFVRPAVEKAWKAQQK